MEEDNQEQEPLLTVEVDETEALPERRIVILGKRGSGKTTLAHWFANGRYVPPRAGYGRGADWFRRLGLQSSESVCMQHSYVTLDIPDDYYLEALQRGETANLHHLEETLMNAHAVIVTYDVADYHSYTAALSICRALKQVPVPMQLIGCQLAVREETSEELAQRTLEEDSTDLTPQLVAADRKVTAAVAQDGLMNTVKTLPADNGVTKAALQERLKDKGWKHIELNLAHDATNPIRSLLADWVKGDLKTPNAQRQAEQVAAAVAHHTPNHVIEDKEVQEEASAEENEVPWRSILLFGTQESQKTALLQKFVGPQKTLPEVSEQNRFHQLLPEPVVHEFNSSLVMDIHNVNAGLPFLTSAAIREAPHHHAVMVVFYFDDLESFQEAEKFCQTVRPPEYDGTVMLVGILSDDEPVVSKAEAAQLAADTDALYREVSLNNEKAGDETFLGLMENVLAAEQAESERILPKSLSTPFEQYGFFRRHAFKIACWTLGLTLGCLAGWAAFTTGVAALALALPWMVLAYAGVGLLLSNAPIIGNWGVHYRTTYGVTLGQLLTWQFVAVPEGAADAVISNRYVDLRGGVSGYEYGSGQFALLPRSVYNAFVGTGGYKSWIADTDSQAAVSSARREAEAAQKRLHSDHLLAWARLSRRTDKAVAAPLEEKDQATEGYWDRLVAWHKGNAVGDPPPRDAGETAEPQYWDRMAAWYRAGEVGDPPPRHMDNETLDESLYWDRLAAWYKAGMPGEPSPRDTKQTQRETCDETRYWAELVGWYTLGEAGDPPSRESHSLSPVG